MHPNITVPTGSADCLSARRALELAIPGQTDGKIEQAREHVHSCAACQRAMALRETIDAFAWPKFVAMSKCLPD